MDNNDILIRLRFALDIKDTDMIKIFKLGGIKVTKEDVLKILTKTQDPFDEEYDDYDEYNEYEENYIKCDNQMLDAFLNGFIIFKRGEQATKPGQVKKVTILKHNNVNNILLKKLKIALSLTSDDMLDLFKLAGITVSKSELSAILRKEGHKNYKECGDMFARNILKGLALKHRKDL